MASLYLIPVTLGQTAIDRVLPAYNTDVIHSIRHFIVEEIRTARRFLKQVDRDIDIDSLTFYPIGKHADPALFSRYLEPLRKGESVGVISEAGCPAVADPGADVVAIAQTRGAQRGSARWPFFYPAVGHGLGIQRTELCFPRLSAHRQQRPQQASQTTGSACHQ